jgi:AraC family transcriptional regulator
MNGLSDAATSTRPTLMEWFAQPLVKSVDQSDPVGSYGVQLYVARLAPSYEKLLTPEVEDNFVIFLRHGVTRIQTDFRVSGSYETLLRPGSLEIMPPGFDGASNWLSPVEVGFVRLSPRLFESFGDSAIKGDPQRVEITPQFGIYDPLVVQLAEALCHEMHDPVRLDVLFVESVTRTLTLHLLRRYSNATVRTSSARAATTLTATQRRRIEDYVEAQLDTRISLQDLARQLHVSVPHFARQFRATYGRPPYRYVLEQRVERGKALLKHTRLPLHEVARRCGFADQSHFTKHFTRFVGMPPARFAATQP